MGDQPPFYGASSARPWVGSQKNVANPASPSGSGGTGNFLDARPTGQPADSATGVAHPHSPAARHLTLDNKQTKNILAGGRSKAKDAPRARETLGAVVKAGADALVGHPAVGSGECFDLADILLRKNGAKTAADFGQVTADANYVWGERVRGWSDVKPGDILQFRDFRITVTKKVTNSYKYRDGRTASDWNETSDFQERPHHTAVVSAKRIDGAIEIVEQNFPDPVSGDQTIVLKTVLPAAGVTNLPVQSSRGQDDSGPFTQEVQTRVTVQFSGTVWIYRPVAK
jgi:hypothetical protein